MYRTLNGNNIVTNFVSNTQFNWTSVEGSLLCKPHGMTQEKDYMKVQESSQAPRFIHSFISVDPYRITEQLCKYSNTNIL
jgi:hypothetical protein